MPTPMAPLFIRVPDTIAPPPPPSGMAEWTVDRAAIPIQFILGVDLGQAQDFSAIVINHLHAVTREHHVRAKFQCGGETLAREEMIVHHRLRHVRRIPRGTSYPAVVDAVASTLDQLPPSPRPPILVVDASGCGRPVMDMMRKQGMTPLGVTITAGGGETIERSDARVAKKILASGVAVALDTGRLTVPAVGPDVETLQNELRAFRVKITASNNDTFEAAREGDHDDLVLSAALAIWCGERVGPRYRVNPNWRLMGNN